MTICFYRHRFWELLARFVGQNNILADYLLIGTNYSPIGADYLPIDTNYSPIGTDCSPIGTDYSPIGMDYLPIGMDYSLIGAKKCLKITDIIIINLKLKNYGKTKGLYS